MSPLSISYLLIWIVLCILCVTLIWRRRETLLLLKREYWIFLLKPWKLITFLIAVISLCFISTLGYDPTWDIPETILMSLLTYCTAPYSVGIMYRFYRAMWSSLQELFIAIILLFFSACWLYDAYVMLFLMRWDYPLSALWNIGISPFFYIFAGMLWSMDYRKWPGVVLIYTQKEWIHFLWEKSAFSKMFIAMIPIFLFMGAVFWYFIYMNISNLG